MISPKYLNLIKQNADATLYYIKETSHPSPKQLVYIIKQNIQHTKLGLTITIEAYQQYTTNKSPILDELIALREDLNEFEKTL